MHKFVELSDSNSSNSLTNTNNCIEILHDSPSQSNDSDSTIIETNIDLESIANKYINNARTTIKDKVEVTSDKPFTPIYDFTDSNSDSDVESLIPDIPCNFKGVTKLTHLSTNPMPTSSKYDLESIKRAPNSINVEVTSDKPFTPIYDFTDSNSDSDVESLIPCNFKGVTKLTHLSTNPMPTSSKYDLESSKRAPNSINVEVTSDKPFTPIYFTDSTSDSEVESLIPCNFKGVTKLTHLSTNPMPISSKYDLESSKRAPNSINVEVTSDKPFTPIYFTDSTSDSEVESLIPCNFKGVTKLTHLSTNPMPISSKYDLESSKRAPNSINVEVTSDKPFTPIYDFTDSNSDSEVESLIPCNFKGVTKLTHLSTNPMPTSSKYDLESSKPAPNSISTSTKPDLELESIIKKYTSSTASSSTDVNILSNNADEPIELSSDDDLPLVKIKSVVPTDVNTYDLQSDIDLNTDELFRKYNAVSNGTEDDTSKIGEELPKMVHNDILEDNFGSYSSPKKKRKMNPDRVTKKMEKAAQQAKKREEAERARKLKQALIARNKNMKPEECIKFVTVFLDAEIANEKYGGEILNALQAIDATYRLQSQLIPYTVTWNHKVQKHVMNDNEEITETSEVVETSEILLIMNWNKVVELVHDQSLVQHVESIKSILGNKKLSLAIYGLENYFRFQKNQKQKKLRSDVTQSQASQTSNKKTDLMYKDVPKISKRQLELPLTELQLLCCCCHRTVETSQDLGGMIAQYTKAIAQAPYKLEKYQKEQEAQWYMCGDNRDCVRVDKNGNGLQRLWQQQLTAFPLVRLEHAEAITAKYPTPLSLMEEYSQHSQEQGEKLLQDIPIRRAAGPLTTVRKIGPELSKKVHTFFTATDGDVVL